MIKLTLQQWGYAILLGSILILLLILGYKSAKLKRVAAALMKKTGDLAIEKLKIKKENLQKKVRSLDANRIKKANAYRDYIDKLNRKS